MRRERKKKRIIIFSLITVLFLMVVGYAAFQTKLEIKGTSNISSEWRIEITNVLVSNKNGLGENVNFEHTKTTASIEANLYEKGDYVEYDVEVSNLGTLDAEIDNIANNIKSTNKAVKISFSGYAKGQVLKAKEKQTIKVKIEYDSNYSGDVSEGPAEVEVQPEYIQHNPGGTTPLPDRYLVSYDCTTNGGKDCSENNEYLTEGDEVNLNPSGVKENYTFIGWNTNKDATTGLTNLSMGTSDITLYAIYKSNITSIETLTATLSETTYTYDGSVKTPSVTVKSGEVTLTKDIDYTVEYKDNTNAGTATVTITGKGKYNGTVTKTFKINKATPILTLSSSTASVGYNSGTASVTYSYDGDGTVSCTSSNISYAVCSVNTSNETITITGKAYTTTKQTITIQATAGTNYSAATDKTITITLTDDVKPTITLSPNTQSTYVSGGKDVTVTLADAGSGLKADQTVSYAWSTSSTTAPTSFTDLTTSNSASAASTTVTVPVSASASLTGIYYLWIKVGTVADVAGNTNDVKTSSEFKFDNTAPTCTSSGGSNKWIALSQTITGTCSDDHSGCSNDTITKTYSIAAGTSGKYDSSYSPGTITDAVGNTAECPAVKVRVTGNTVADYGDSSCGFIYDGKTGLSGTIWKDQSSAGHNATLVGATISGNSVLFDGTNDYVRIAQINKSEVTLEVVFKTTKTGASQNIIGNIHLGGYRLFISSENYYGSSVYRNGSYKTLASTNTLSTNKMYFGAGTFDGVSSFMKLNDETKSSTTTYPIGQTTGSSYMLLGANPKGNIAENEYFKGNIYAARMYCAIRTDDRLQRDYVIDKSRFDF